MKKGAYILCKMTTKGLHSSFRLVLNRQKDLENLFLACCRISSTCVFYLCLSRRLTFSRVISLSPFSDPNIAQQ